MKTLVEKTKKFSGRVLRFCLCLLSGILAIKKTKSKYIKDKNEKN